MTIAVGVAKQVTYKAESTWGTIPSAGSAQSLRRVSSNLRLKKDSYQSSEIRTDYQVSDMRHGVRSVEGSISGEVSAGTWEDFLAAAVRRAFTAVSSITGLSVTVSGSGPTYTVARGSGSFLTDNIKAGMVVRLTAGSFDAANLNKNLLVTAAVALSLTVIPLNGVALTAEGPIASATLAVPGKWTYAPTSSHTDPSFSIEHWHSDVSQSEVFSGCKVNTLDLALPPTGMSTINVGIMGKDIETDTSQYFTSPTAQTTTGVMAAVNGALLVNGTQVALLTGLNISVKGNMSAEPVVGSNTYADIAEGRITVDGSMTVMFESGTFRDYFINETEISIIAALSASNAAAADFIAVVLPRIKVGSSDPDDGEKNIVQTLSFTGLYNGSGGSGTSSEATTICFQDSQA